MLSALEDPQHLNGLLKMQREMITFMQKNLYLHRVTSLIEIICREGPASSVYRRLGLGWKGCVIGAQALKRRASAMETLK